MTGLARQPLAQPPAKVPLAPAPVRRLQRQCACGKHSPDGSECEACRQKKLQRQAAGAAAGAAPGIVGDVLSSPGHPLEAGVRAFMEPRFGQDFSRVRVHADARAAQSARSVNALAYTVGQDLVFAAGQYEPGSPRGRRLLAHELAHTLQQRGASSGPPQAKLEIDAADSPLEAAADQAADAVLRGGPPPALLSAGPTLSRQVAETRTLPEERGECRPSPLANTDLSHIDFPTAEAPTGKYSITGVEPVSDNVKRVRISTGKSYKVYRIPQASLGEVPKTTLHANPGIDKQDVWLELEFCRGETKGTIRVGANVPDQVIQLMLNTLTSGGDVSAAWAKASITPSVSGSVKTGHWSIDLSAHTTVDTKGKDTGAGGEVSVSTDVGGGRATVGASVDSQTVGTNPLGGAQGQLFFRYEWGGSQTPPKCPTEKLKAGFTYECYEEQDVQRPGTQSVTKTDERDYNLFFKYAVPDFDDPRNKDTWRDLAADLATGGYQVAHIEGWASPEGPMGKGRGGFVGNEVLSQQRADAVKKRILALCKGAACLAPGAEVVGKGERLDPTDEEGTPQDVKGKELEQHVVDTFPTDPKEASVRTPALTKTLEKTPSLHGRAEKIYPELRRAIVTLRKSTPGSDKCTFTVHQDAHLNECPDDVRKAAFPDNQS